MASEILRELVELLGHQPAIELVRAWGGRRLKVPVDMHQDHALVFVVGWEAAGKLSKTYGGADAIDIPAERNHLIDMRNDAVLVGFQAGRSITWLSETYGISRRQVNSVLDRMGYNTERMARAVATRT